MCIRDRLQIRLRSSRQSAHGGAQQNRLTEVVQVEFPVLGLSLIHIFPELTVEQNILFPVLLDYQKPNQTYLEELLKVLNLSERRRHLPSQLSGGQQQRVAIGRALITRPSLILADEPTGNLDTQNSSEVITLLKDCLLYTSGIPPAC